MRNSAVENGSVPTSTAAKVRSMLPALVYEYKFN